MPILKISKRLVFTEMLPNYDATPAGRARESFVAAYVFSLLCERDATNYFSLRIASK